MRIKLKKVSTLLVLAFACVIAGLLFLLFPVFPGQKVKTVSAATGDVTVSSSGAYQLFNSGCSSYSPYASNSNPTLTNNNQNLYFTTSGTRQGYIGIPFEMDGTMTERSTVTINAYDVDESSGEIDGIYLYDLTAGTNLRVGQLVGQDSKWTTTTLQLAPNLFQNGHRYRFYLNVEVSGWVVYVKSVNFNAGKVEGGINTPVVVDPIKEASISASIDSSRYVTANLNVTAAEAKTFNVEFTAKHVATNNQLGSLNTTIDATTSGSTISKSFYLESGAPAGNYEITAVIKDASGNVLKTVACNAGYSYQTVSYNPNGGSNNCPIDSNAYSNGSTVTVKFDYIPSKTGYTFQGWSTDRYATVPQYTVDGNKTFTMGSSDVTLYAVWKTSVCSHNFVNTTKIDPTCTTNGIQYAECTECGKEQKTIVYATGHDWTVTGEQAPTCNVDGWKELLCSVCGATKKETVETKGHNWGPEAEYMQPTCTENGYWLTECLVCEVTSRIEDYDSALGHDYSECEVTQDATCTQVGYVTGECVRCHETLEEEIPALGHSFTYVDNGDGLTHNATCGACGDHVTEEHKAGMKVCVCGYINPYYLSVLLIQDSTPWNVEANAATLNGLVANGNIDGWEQCTTTAFASMDAMQYSVIVFANDQNDQTYQNYSKIKNQLDAYVSAGGVLVFGACWHGWRGGTLTDTLLGGVGTAYDIDYTNSIVDTAHPIVTGELTGNDSLVNNDLRSTYASHIYFTNLPQGANVIFQNEAGQPTLVEYAYGAGKVIASGLTWEYSTVHCSYSYFADKAMDDMVVYALTQTSILPTEMKYTVTYTDYDGTVLFVERVLPGENAVANVAPERLGYVFDGWDISLTNITANVKAVAQYTANKYDVSLTCDTQQGSVTGGGSYDMDESVILSAEAKTGYVFSGWYLNGQLLSTDADFVYTVSANDVAIEARFQTEIPANSTVLTVGGTVAGVGDEFRAEITLSGNVGLSNITAYIAYDSNILELVDILDGGLLGGASHGVIGSNPFMISWTNGADTDVNGVIIILIFRIRINTPDQTIINVNNFTASNQSGYSVPSVGVSGYTDILEKHDVIFNTYGGSSIGGQLITEGGKLNQNVVPEKTGYVFGGWYKDDQFTQAWDFENDVVTEDTTLHASWIAIKIIVIFIDVDLSNQEVAFDSKIAYLVPEKAGWLFIGWFLDEGLSVRWNESDVINSENHFDKQTREMKLYPGWKHQAHEFEKKVVSEEYFASEATCATPAQYYFSCDCGEKGTQTFSYGITNEHDYRANVVAPTCTEGGYTTYACPACGDSYTVDETAATGHSYEAVGKNPTCTEGGHLKYTCTVCQHGYEADLDALGHSYEKDVTAPTCTEGGYTTYTCSVCGDSYVGDETAATGHSYKEEVVAPTYEAEGYTKHTCEACGDSYQDNVVPKLIPLGERDSLMAGCASALGDNLAIVTLTLAGAFVFLAKKRRKGN